MKIILGEVGTPLTKIDVEIFDYVTGKKYISLKNVPVQDNRIQIATTSIDSIFKKAGKYTLSIHSGELAGETRFTIVPAAPDHVTTTLPAILIKGKTQSLSIAIQDIYNNDLLSENWNLNLSTSIPTTLSGFGDGKSTKQFQ